MNDNTLAVFVVALGILTIFLFAGDPDIHDAIIANLMAGVNAK